MIETESQKAPQETSPACPVPRGMQKWIKRFGVAGFMFFLIKGLLWLTVPAVLAWWGTR